MQNWAPVIDFQLEDLRTNSHGTGADRDRAFACTGRGDHGAITELRYGVQANIQFNADYLPSIGQLFILPDAAQRGYFVVSALPDHSQLCFFTPDGELSDCSDNEALCLGERTLVAGALARGFKGENDYGAEQEMMTWCVQVTPSAVTMVKLNSDDEVWVEDGEEQENTNGAVAKKLQRRCDDGDRIIAAALHGSEVLVAMRGSAGVNLILASIDVAADRYVVFLTVGDGC